MIVMNTYHQTITGIESVAVINPRIRLLRNTGKTLYPSLPLQMNNANNSAAAIPDTFCPGINSANDQVLIHNNSAMTHNGTTVAVTANATSINFRSNAFDPASIFINSFRTASAGPILFIATSNTSTSLRPE